MGPNGLLGTLWVAYQAQLRRRASIAIHGPMETASHGIDSNGALTVR
jgi:hypothetical protein